MDTAEDQNEFIRRANTVISCHSNVFSISVSSKCTDVPFRWFSGIAWQGVAKVSMVGVTIRRGDMGILRLPCLCWLEFEGCAIGSDCCLDFSQGFDGLKTLRITNSGLVDLCTQVRFPCSVERLMLYGNLLTGLKDVMWPCSLERLCVRDNRIEHVDLSGVAHTSLHSFGVQNNRITRLSIRGGPKTLRYINVMDNPLEDFFIVQGDLDCGVIVEVHGCPLSACCVKRLKLYRDTFYRGEGDYRARRLIRIQDAIHARMVLFNVAGRPPFGLLPPELLRVVFTRYL